MNNPSLSVASGAVVCQWIGVLIGEVSASMVMLRWGVCERARQLSDDKIENGVHVGQRAAGVMSTVSLFGA